MTKNTIDTFIAIEAAAHSGAFGDNPMPTPTDAQAIAGNYKLGRVSIYNLPVSIEQPRHSYRTGLDKNGKRWTSRLAAHYGFFPKTKGADSNPIDCFIGFYPQSEHVYIINQFVNGQWDEHKICIAFPDEQTARRAYLDSYDKGWAGLQSMVKASISQLKWWLKNGNHKNPLLPNHLPYEGFETMTHQVTWDNAAKPVGMSLDKLLYEIKRADSGEGLIFDACTMADILEDSEQIMMLDALVTPYAKLQRKMDILKTIMERTGGTIKPVALQISDPFKSGGVLQVAVIFELSDGQTISIFFHNPDVDPKKIMPTDELISWKWLLNKKDVTIVVAPEKGVDLNVKQAAERIIGLAEKNSVAFQRANVNRAAKMQVIEDIKTEITGLEAELKTVQHELEVAKVEADDRVTKPPVIDWSKSSELDTNAKVKAIGIARIGEIDSENGYILPGSTNQPQEPNEQTNQQTEVTAQAEEAGSEGGALAIVDSSFTDAGGAVYKDKIAAFIKENYGDEPKILVISTDENGNVLSLKKTTEGGVKRAMNAASNGEDAGSVKAISANNGGKYLKALGHDISSEISVKLPSWINEDGTYMLDKGYHKGVPTGDFYRGVKFTGILNMEFNFSGSLTSLPIDFDKINDIISSGMLKESDGKEDISEFSAEYVNSKGKSVAKVLKEINGVTGEVSYGVSGEGFGGGSYSYNEVINKLLMIKEYAPSMKLLNGVDFLKSESGNSTDQTKNLNTLQSIVDGKHDGMDLSELLSMIDAAATGIIEHGDGEKYDALIGAAADKYASLDLLKYGN